MPRTRLLLADDHKLFRAGIRALLQTVGDVEEVVAEASNGREALRLVEAHRPDVVLLDIMMPGMNGHPYQTRGRRRLTVDLPAQGIHARPAKTRSEWNAVRARIATLSERERQVMDGLLRGQNTKELASGLGIGTPKPS
jgi:DNA-binding NarL/FixJ family response regulator